jgi:excisionase family DNA binding protein
MSINPSPWLTLSEASEYARVSISTIKRWVSDKKVKPYSIKRTGTKWGSKRFKAAEIDAAITGEGK